LNPPPPGSYRLRQIRKAPAHEHYQSPVISKAPANPSLPRLRQSRCERVTNEIPARARISFLIFFSRLHGPIGYKLEHTLEVIRTGPDLPPETLRLLLACPDSEKFVVLGESVPPPRFVVRAISHAKAQARVRAVAKMQGNVCPRLFSCRPPYFGSRYSRNSFYSRWYFSSLPFASCLRCLVMTTTWFARPTPLQAITIRRRATAAG
jgi:hypothetical protein